jgi:nucleoside 2-deoxyribosyltransferase
MRAYLAGPDVFLPNAIEIGEMKKAICSEFGIEGLFPLDNELDFKGRSASECAFLIYRENVSLMQKADVVIANMTPFRGPSMDVGTAFEMGFMLAAGKSVFGYSASTVRYATKVAEWQNSKDPEAAVDRDGYIIEKFGLQDNLMMMGAVFASEIGKVISAEEEGEEGLAALKSFRKCVNRVAMIENVQAA